MAILIKKLVDFTRRSSGAALIEFAFVFPFIALLMFGAIEMARYVLITQKIERAGYLLGDTLSQYKQEELSMAALDTVFQQYFTMMNPYGVSTKQSVIISSVTKDPSDHKIKIRWQYSGGGTLRNDKTVSIVSGRNIDQINTVHVGDDALFSGDVATQLNSMLDSENMVVAEAFFQYEPVFSRLLSSTTAQSLDLGPRTLIRRTFFHPRNGDLHCPPGMVMTSSTGGGITCAPSSSSTSSGSASGTSASSASSTSASSTSSTSSTSASSTSTSSTGGSTSSTSASSTSASSTSASSTSAGGSSGRGSSAGGGCFTADTRVLMADGTEKPIAEVKKGDLLAGQHGPNRVLSVYIHHSDEPIYSINGSDPFITGEHPILTPEGWKSIDPALTYKESRHAMRTQPLSRNDQMLHEDGSTTTVDTIVGVQNGPYTLYNVHLTGDHTYYANGILVHNLINKF